ncbi:MAG: prolyl oligopeptidase family serine peptidase, partial [Candidatus Eremiobacteraeota bacterium]|nr:prolyl oligopeptidase family serine peptidase [Candidatus Eremiobacteraeota bacterium]
YAYGKDGRVFVASADDTTSRLVAGPAKDAKAKTDSAADTTKAARDARDRERFTAVSFSPKGDALLATNKDGFWIVDVASGAKEMFLATPDSATHPPARAVIAWAPDGRSLYLSHASRTEWKRGILRYDRDTKQLAELAVDTRSYSGFRISKNGTVAAVAIGDVYRPADLYVGDADLTHLRRVVHSNPQLDGKALGHAALTTYLDADGHGKYAVVYYPPDYDASKRYPTVFNIYEEFFNDAFDPVFNLLNASGYVVVQPSVDFDIGYPGEAWVKGVTAAANKLIELGIADSSKLGVHGTSYGGYATNLLITQTNRFKAAINISGKVDIISFYTDSPRLGVRNIHAAEKSQDRIGATLWQQPQKYVQQSAIMFADRITTPLLLLTGAQDQNVPADNTREMFYALRRLGKEVVWVNYMNGGHGAGNASVADYVDFLGRVTSWFDSHLKSDAKKGVATAEQAAPPSTDIFLATLSSARGAVTIGTPVNITHRDGYDNQPSFTPDGRAILYTVRADSQTDIWRYDIASRTSSQLTHTPESEYSATVTPDGRGFSVIRVERDSTQRLWRFTMRGDSATLVLERVKPVGYHVWADDSTLALFVLGKPATLQIASARTGNARVVASSIGRSLQNIPRASAVSFVQQDSARGPSIMRLDARTAVMSPIAPRPDGNEYHAWTPGGVLLATKGASIIRWDNAAKAWRDVVTFTDPALAKLSRIAVSAQGDWIAIVAERAR